MKTNKMSTGKKIAIGAGVVVAAAAAYFLYNKKNRKAVKTWALKMKADVIEALENAGEMSKETYETVIDKISEKYKKVANLEQAEVAEVVGELKKKWNEIKRGMGDSKPVKKVKSVAKKIVKKVAKKAK